MKQTLRVLGIVFAVLFMTGFGFCGAMGVMIGAGSHDEFGGMVLVLGLLGLGIAVACALALRWLVKSRKTPQPPEPPKDQA
ncbi:MAG TPA: hypothetical protein VF472_10955 [Burkholderiaceae bacterium]